MNNADILAMLGGAGIPGAGSSRREEEGKTILTFKAGKMDPVLQPVSVIYLFIYLSMSHGNLLLIYQMSNHLFRIQKWIYIYIYRMENTSSPLIVAEVKYHSSIPFPHPPVPETSNWNGKIDVLKVSNPFPSFRKMEGPLHRFRLVVRENVSMFFNLGVIRNDVSFIGCRINWIQMWMINIVLI